MVRLGVCLLWNWISIEIPRKVKNITEEIQSFIFKEQKFGNIPLRFGRFSTLHRHFHNE